MEFFRQLLSPDFMPHGFCYLWDPRIVWLHVISDGLITLSYYCIPIVLVYFIRKNRNLPFNRIFWMFGTFILACGTTHLMEIWNVWHGSYLLAGVIKAITAGVSVITAAMLIPLVPKVISLPERMHLQGREITERALAEEALKESLTASEAALKELADQKFALDQHAIVAITDVQGTITYVNDKFCAISQYSKEQLIGQNHRILNSGHHPKEFFQEMYRAIANGKVWHGEIKNRAKDGSIYWVDTTIVPFLTHEGKPRQYVAIRADITESKRGESALKESLATSDRALKELADQKFALDQHAIVAVTDVQGTITYVNEKFCAISQYPKEELIGQNHRILNSGHHPTEFFQQMYYTIAKGKVWQGEIKNRAKDGSIYWVDTTIVPFMSAEGKPRQYMAIRADITERKRAEEMRERLAAVVESSDDAIISKTLDGTITAWNHGAETVFGYSSAEAVGKPMRIIIPPECAREESDILTRIARGESVEHFETTRVRRNGTYIDISATISPIKNSSGVIVGASKIARDITERKRAEETLKKSLATSESALKELADQKFALDQHAIVAVTDVQGTITYVNDKFCAISQYSEDELIGQNHRILNSGHHSKEFFQQMYHTIANGKVWHGEIKNRAKDGSIYWVDTTIVPTLSTEGKPRQYVAIRADITERKLAAEALTEQAMELSRSQQALEAQTLMLQSVLDSMAEGLVAADEQGKFLIWNRAAERIVGYGPADLPTQEWSEHYGNYLPDGVTLFPTDQLPLVRAIHGEASTAEIFLRSPKVAQGAWIEASGGPLRGKDGVVRGGVVAFRDITQRKEDEREILKLNNELEQRVAERTAQLETANKELADQKFALDQHAIVAMTNVQGTITYVNDKFCAISQYSESELLGRNHRTLNSGHHSKEFFQQMYRTIAHGQVWHGEIKNRAKDGSTYWLDTTIVPFVGAEGKPRQYAAIRADITERKQAEERVLQRTAELEAANKELEAFSYSVSHDLRAPLRHIGGFSKMLMEEFGPTLDPAAQHYVERIQVGTQRMGLLVDELLNLARIGRHSLNRYAVRLNVIVAEVITILEPESEGRQVEWVIADLPAVECDPVLVRQVFQNLLANALKFTRPRARAVIEVSHIENERDGQPVLMVRDNGIGFDMKYVDKLFGVFQRLHRAEDFEGTGIGLATVQRIVQKHGGRVWTEGKLDQGAAFYFTLGAEKQTESKSNEAAAGGQS